MVAREVYTRFKSAIDTGELQPGARLPPERELVKTFGGARTAVRRAILALEAEGALERHVGRGTFVRADHKNGNGPRSDIEASPLDVLEARLAIEPGFTDLVVARATPADFDRMKAWLVRQEKATTQRDFRIAGYNYHLEIARATRNPIIAGIFEMIVDARARAGWGRLRELNVNSSQRQVQTEANQRILEALRNRDAPLARKLIRAHLGSLVSAVAGLAPEDDGM
jgi:DNA-binding FadR family transcriptional regulator